LAYVSLGDNMDNMIDSTKQEIKLIDRALIYLSGIDRIIKFDSDEFFMDSVMGLLTVKGEGLEVVKLDTHDGIVSIKGKVNSIVYDDEKKKETESFLTKLFK
jgi:sporulation protein YabP